MKTLCIIAGRAGSKRLPGKNIMQLNGKPLIAHSIEQAKLSGVCDTVAVSSDSQQILAAAQAADILINRPAELATDTATSFDVITHAIGEAEKMAGDDYATIIFLQITSPLRLPEDIKKALHIFAEKPVSNLLSVEKRVNLRVKFNNGHAEKARDFGKDSYEINGSIYIWNKERFLANPQHVYPDTRLMEMPATRSIDIDYKADFDHAELLMKSGEYKNGEAKAVN